MRRTLGGVLGSLMLLSAHSSAQERVPLLWNQEIPTAGYRSWSLFLVCDPAWLHPERAEALLDLRRRYGYFGDTTGPAHAAVWFTTTADPDSPLDVERMRQYCDRFTLVGSEGPHIVVTTVHPDRWTPGDSRIVLAFGELPARDIQERLSKLNDRITLGGLWREELDSERWWAVWVRVLESACDWLDKVKWGINAKVLRIEREGVCR
jgi:hypothetical protein